MSVQCIINHWYKGICRNPDTEDAGLCPSSYEDSDNYHLGYFQRTLREELREKAGGSIDRCVQIEYKGTKGAGPFITGGKIRFTDHLQVCVGYFAGDHHDVTHAVAYADDRLIQHWVLKPSNYPACQGTCVERVELVGSQLIKKGDEQYVLEIEFSVQSVSGRGVV